MPIGRSAKKSLRKSIKNNLVNSEMKKKVHRAVKDFTSKPTVEAMNKAVSTIDKAVKNGIIHHNRAARIRARLAKILTLKAEKTTKPKATTVKKTVKKIAKKKIAK